MKIRSHWFRLLTLTAAGISAAYVLSGHASAMCTTDQSTGSLQKSASIYQLNNALFRSPFVFLLKPSHLLKAQAFNLKDVDGRVHSLSEYHNRRVALFFFCGCPWCHRCATIWGQFQRSGVLSQASEGTSQRADSLSPLPSRLPPLSLIVFSGNSASAREFAMQTGLDLKQTILLPDPDMRVTTLYRAEPCPRVFILDPQGVIHYTNSHKDDAPQKASEIVIASRALDALRASSPADPSPTKQPH